MAEKLAFLTSRRFWALVLLGVVAYFKSTGQLEPGLAQLFETILGGFTVLTTVDKFRRA